MTAAGAVATSAARPPTTAPAPTAPPGMSPAEIKVLVELAETMKKQTHFEALGVSKETDPAAVKTAYLKAARIYHPDTIPQGAPAAFAKAKGDIFARITEANRTLGDAKARAEYVAELAAGGTGEKVDITGIFAAEEHFQKGCILVKARKFADALKMLDDAIAANAEEGEYYAWRGYARFFLNPDKKIGHAEALKDIQACLKKNPNVASAHFFQGNMAKLLGDPATAKTHFQKCVQLDPKHIDAQRELRSMK